MVNQYFFIKPGRDSSLRSFSRVDFSAFRAGVDFFDGFDRTFVRGIRNFFRMVIHLYSALRTLHFLFALRFAHKCLILKLITHDGIIQSKYFLFHAEGRGSSKSAL